MTGSGKRLTLFLFVAASLHAPSRGMAAELSKGDVERMVQSYLAVWSRDDAINAASVARFYAPRVVYYGKPMSRTGVLADKRAYIRRWPVRSYAEVPGSFAGTCRPDHSRCKATFEMRFRRVSRSAHVAAGRARLTFDFVPTDGGLRIAQESARPL
jgi:hypothetical protein